MKKSERMKQKSEMMNMLLEAHQQIGELQERNAQAQAELQRMRLNFLDPVDFQRLVKQVLAEDKGFVPLVRLYRKVTGSCLVDSKKFVDQSPLGQLIRANKTT